MSRKIVIKLNGSHARARYDVSIHNVPEGHTNQLAIATEEELRNSLVQLGLVPPLISSLVEFLQNSHDSVTIASA